MFKVTNAMGLDDSHVTRLTLSDNRFAIVHQQMVAPLERLYGDAKRAGFELGIASGYRSYIRQRDIWNAKAQGLRPVLSATETPLNICELTEQELVLAIMRWSALPGASRHHWGTDIDVYDVSALKGEVLALTLIETQTVFAPFYWWLNDYLKAQNEWRRPYDGRGSIAEEPWHLSFAPLAVDYQNLLTPNDIAQQMLNKDVALAEVIVRQLPDLYQSHVAAYFVSLDEQQ